MQQASRREVDAPGQSACAARLPHPALGGRKGVGAHSQSATATIHCHAAKHRLGHAHHLHPHWARVALSRCRHGSIRSVHMGQTAPGDESETVARHGSGPKPVTSDSSAVIVWSAIAKTVWVNCGRLEYWRGTTEIASR